MTRKSGTIQYAGGEKKQLIAYNLFLGVSPLANSDG